MTPAGLARGRAQAQLELGHAYRLGLGVEPSLEEAYKWYKLAAQSGLPAAKAEAASLEKSLNMSPGAFRDQ